MNNAARTIETETRSARTPTLVADNDGLPVEALGDVGIAAIMEAMALSKATGEPVVIRARISPITAAWLLGENERNRTMSDPISIQYANDIAEGRWMENGDGLGISKCRKLNNGQHRCQGIMRSGVTITTNVTVGLERDARATNDIGLPRTLSALLAMDGVANHTIVGVMTKLVIGWETTGKAAKRPTRESSPTRVRQAIANDDSIPDSASFVRTVKVPKGFLSKPQIGFFHNILVKHDPDNAEAFMRALVTGNEDGRGLRVEDPRNVIRTRLIAEHKTLKHADRVELVFRGWNAWREGRALTASRITGTLPELV